MIKMKDGNVLTLEAIQDAIDTLRALRGDTWEVCRIAKGYLDQNGCIYLVGTYCNVGIGHCRGSGDGIKHAVAYRLGLRCICEAQPNTLRSGEKIVGDFNPSDCEEIF